MRYIVQLDMETDEKDDLNVFMEEIADVLLSAKCCDALCVPAVLRVDEDDGVVDGLIPFVEQELKRQK